jgi:hypothetical protein
VIPIAFCSNWERTDTWIATGQALRERGTEVCFVMTRDEYVNKALAAGFPRERILWLRRDEARAAKPSAADLELLRAYEQATGERVKHMILMDRFMRSAEPASALNYAVYVFRKLLDFLQRHKVRLVSGQPDNIPDLLALMIMRRHGGHYAAAFEMRLPVRRFMLWDSRIEQQPHLTGAVTPEAVDSAMLEEARALRDRVRSGARMHQVTRKSEQPRMGWRWLQRITRGLLYRALVVSRHDAYMYTLRSVLFDLKFHMIAINHALNRLMWSQLFDQPVPGERFVLFTLNYAPEHTLDVEAPWFTDTEETVRNLARTLPLGIRLYVKEHPVALGIRGPLALRRLRRIPGVRLIDPHVDSHALIRASELVVTLSGTASLEAALYGKRTALLSDLFILRFSTCERMQAPWQLNEVLQSAPPRPYDEEADLRTLAWLLSNSHPGTVIEPLTDPEALSPQNVAQVADGYLKVIRKLAGP